jgi:hypothetical protein
MSSSEKVDSPATRAKPERARKSARSWGDINLTLNRLVREGIISAFKTNLSSPDRTSGLTVNITPAPGTDIEAAKTRVMSDLEVLIEDAVVTVEEPQAA